MASCVLPPIRSSPPPPPPVVTFFSVPRRYVKSNMQVGDDKLQPSTGDSKAGRSLRKSTRNQIPRSASGRSPVRHTKEEKLSMPSSPQGPRRRHGSLEADDDFEEVVQDDSLADVKTPASTGSTGSGDLSPHVCLCQPEPKIPRPRNAFILYRQHHQQNIIRRNPGLNNPDISKIIGEQWKSESDEEKKVWQDLAQEEKARHHEQYPDYRYQPRRINKPGTSPLNPGGQHTTVDKYRCPRCGGRSIKTPTSPYPVEPQGTPTLPPPNASEGLTPTTRYLPMMSSLSLDSPAVARRGPGPSRLSNIQIPSSIREHEMYSPLTPGQKRRRYDYGPPPSARRPDGPYYPQSAARRESLPPIHVRVSPPNTAGMHPPSARTPRDARINQHEPPRKSTSSEMNAVVAQNHDQSRSVEAMVLSVPYQARIKLLGRICAPLKEPGPTGPATQTRGAIIAVEGDDLKAVQDLAEWLNEFLSKDEEYSSRVADPPKAPVDTKPDVSFEAYLDLIKEWHGKSKEMIRYIIMPVTHSELVPASSKVDERDTSNRKDSATPPDSARKSASPRVTTSTRATSSAPPKKPIIILPTFQLHASVAYASRIPIQDAYSPTDHWQWMATLWRGIVGPDLTLYIKSYDAKETPQGKMVDLDDQVRCLTVMKAQGKPFADASMRRVGFEVSEWVRGVGARKDA